MQDGYRDAIGQVVSYIRTCDSSFTREDLKEYSRGAGLPLCPFDLDRIVLWMKEAGAVREQGDAYMYVGFAEQ